MYLMDSNGVWEASEEPLVFIVGLHEEVEVFPWLWNEVNGHKKKRRRQM